LACAADLLQLGVHAPPAFAGDAGRDAGPGTPLQPQHEVGPQELCCVPCAAPRQSPRRSIAGQFGPRCISPWSPGSLGGQLSCSLEGALSSARARADARAPLLRRRRPRIPQRIFRPGSGRPARPAQPLPSRRALPAEQAVSETPSGGDPAPRSPEAGRRKPGLDVPAPFSREPSSAPGLRQAWDRLPYTYNFMKARRPPRD
jgi:hypothetical protein